MRVPAGRPEGLCPDRGQALVLTAPPNPLGRLRAALHAAQEPWLIRAGGAGLVNHSPGVVETRIRGLETCCNCSKTCRLVPATLLPPVTEQRAPDPGTCAEGCPGAESGSPAGGTGASRWAPSCGAPPLVPAPLPSACGPGASGRARSDVLCSEAAEVVALANQGFASLKQVVGDRCAGVQGFEVLTQLAQLRADVQEQEQGAPVGGVVAVVLRVALHLRARTLGAREAPPPRSSRPPPPSPGQTPATPKHLKAPVCPTYAYGRGVSQAPCRARCRRDLTPHNSLT